MSNLGEGFREDFYSELHRLEGICGCCGKTDCGGKNSHSELPKKILTDNVLDAFNRMIKIHLDEQ